MFWSSRIFAPCPSFCCSSRKSGHGSDRIVDYFQGGYQTLNKQKDEVIEKKGEKASFSVADLRTVELRWQDIVDMI